MYSFYTGVIFCSDYTCTLSPTCCVSKHCCTRFCSDDESAVPAVHSYETASVLTIGGACLQELLHLKVEPDVQSSFTFCQFNHLPFAGCDSLAAWMQMEMMLISVVMVLAKLES